MPTKKHNHRLGSGVALGECDNTLDRTLHLREKKLGLSVSSLRYAFICALFA